MYHTSILHNTCTGRFHPIPYKCAPRPSESWSPGEYCRHKSIGHHTEGFTLLIDAVEHIEGDKRFWPTGIILEWNGQDTPTSVVSFPCDQQMAIIQIDVTEE